MQQALNFLPDPHGQGSLRPTFLPTLRTGSRFFSVELLAAGDGGFLLPADAACGLCRGRELRFRFVVNGLGAIELPS